MLQSISSEHLDLTVFRSIAYSEDIEVMDDMELDWVQQDEMSDLLRQWAMRERLEEIVLNEPFNRHGPARTTRYSDGSFAVFYAAVEADTAKAEIRHHASRCGAQNIRHIVFACNFTGYAKDLRSKVKQWPGLMNDTDYRFCNRVGAEAHADGLDGLLVPSARRAAGANVPVFRRPAIGMPRRIEDWIVYPLGSGG